MDQVSVIIPAYNEEERIAHTLEALVNEKWIGEVIVVDDGSSDSTSSVARNWTQRIIQIPHNQGKAHALFVGAEAAGCPILLFLDADLKESAKQAKALVEPIWREDADMTIAILPQAKNGGFGLVKKFAAWAIYQKTGRKLISPLSGQRAIKKAVFKACYQGDKRFGIEVGLSLDCIERGYQVVELEVPFSHRETGKSIAGFIHRLKQGFFVCHSLLSRRY